MSKKTQTKTKTSANGKARPVFTADYQSAKEKRLQNLRNHGSVQFNYEHVAKPTSSSFDHSGDYDADKIYCHMETSPTKGRILIADMDFKPGDIIFREKPLMTASWNDFHCHECAQPHVYSKCRDFLGIYNDSTILQKNMTKIEDSLLDYSIIGDLDRARLFIKAIWLWQTCPEAPCWTEIQQLTTAGTELSDYLDCVNSFRNKLIVKSSKLIKDTVTDEELAHLLAVLNNNSHEIENFGSGIWLFSSLLEHSCQANTNFVTTPEELVLVAVAHIPTGTPLSIDYNMGCYKPQGYRCQYFTRKYGFSCTCDMCTVGFDRPRAFVCPQSLRYHASFAVANNLSQFTFGTFMNHPPQSLITADIHGNDILADVTTYASHFIVQGQQQNHPIRALMYGFKNIQFSPQLSPFLHTPANTSAPSYYSSQGKCLNGIVYPIGDGSGEWKCAGCQYVLTEQEVAICTSYEQQFHPPPNDGLGKTDTLEDLDDMLGMNDYELPTPGKINEFLSHGVLHYSHSNVYWTLYLSGLQWAKKATDVCYILESSATAQNKKNKSKKGHQNTKNNPIEQTSDAVLDESEHNIRSSLGLFDTTYDPRKEKENKAKKSLPSDNMDMGDESLTISKIFNNNSTSIPISVEYPLLAEHFWTLIAEAVTINLHPLHPELLVIYDYMAQIQLLKKRLRRAKSIWGYCYELSKVINTPFTRETFKIKRLATHTPRNIAQLQMHYQSIDELYDKLEFHQENDTATLDILKQFTLDAFEEELENDDDDHDHDNNDVSNENNNNTSTNNIEEDDEDEFLLQSSFGKKLFGQQPNKSTQSQQQQSQQQQSQAPTQPPMTNSFGFNASALFSENQTQPTFGMSKINQPQQQQQPTQAINGFDGFTTFSGFTPSTSTTPANNTTNTNNKSNTTTMSGFGQFGFK